MAEGKKAGPGKKESPDQEVEPGKQPTREAETVSVKKAPRRNKAPRSQKHPGAGKRPAHASGRRGSTAADQLTRILYILPAASREGGARLEELAGTLEVDRKSVVRDVMEVTNRAYYHPADSGSALQIELTPDRVSIWTSGEFRRPMKLSPREALCVGLALRSRERVRREGIRREEAVAGEGGGEPEILDALERQVATMAPETLLNQVEAADLRTKGTGIRERVGRALRDRECIRIQYLKPGEAEPLNRTVHPYALAHAEGNWYLLAYCEVSEEIRNFRVDRILEASVTGHSFQPLEGFDPREFVQNGRIFAGGDEIPVRIRYGPRIARWIAERESGEWDEAGGFTVTHQVVDPGWLTRHVLQYGPDAQVLEPKEAREWVREVVEKV